jgi:hypothetical protein
MPKLSKILIYCTVAASCFILIAAGHGVAPMIMVEYFALGGIITGNNAIQTCFSFDCSYDNSIVVASMVILLGQFITTIYEIVILSVLGILVILFGFLYLCHNFSHDSLSSFSFFSGMPFVILSIIVLTLVAIQTLCSRLKFK